MTVGILESRTWRSIVTAALLMVALATVRPAAGQVVVLEGGTIIPVAGETLKKGSILIRDGRIAEIGETVETPFDAKVIDVSGKTLFPGMIDVHTWRGMDVPNESPPVTPFLNVYDAIDPAQLFFEDSLRDGVLSIHVSPANNTVIGGLTRVVHPIGMTPDEMTTAAEVAMKIAVSPKNGFDRMLQMATFRETFRRLDETLAKLAVEKYEEKLREDGKDLSVPPEEEERLGRELLKEEHLEEKDRNLLRLTQGKLRTFIFAGAAMDVPAAIRLAKDHGFFEQSVLVLGPECHKAVANLKKAGRPVVLASELIHREVDPFTGEEKETFVPAVIDKAGLAFALQREYGTTLGERYLWYQAARCVREGISREKALKAITLWPAEMLGLGERLGSLEKGKDANVLVLSGDPLDAQTWVEKAFVQGIEVYDRSEDIRLKELLAPPEKGIGPSSQKPPEATKPAEDKTPAVDSAKEQPRERRPGRRPGGRRGGRRPPPGDDGGNEGGE